MQPRTLQTNPYRFVNEAPLTLRVTVLTPAGRYWMYHPEEALERIRFVPMESIVPHEKTLKKYQDELEQKYGDRGFATRVAQVTALGNGKFMIADAHHLTKTLKSFECELICVFDNDYSTLPIAAWYPISGLRPQAIISMSGVKTEKCSLQEGNMLLETNQASFLIVHEGDKGGQVCYALFCSESRAAASLSQLVKSQDDLITRLDAKTAIADYVADEDMEKYQKNGATILVRRPFKHEEVLGYVSEGGLFPAKSTRHIFPIEIRIPLPGEMFYLSVEEANWILRHIKFSNFTFSNWQGL